MTTKVKADAAVEHSKRVVSMAEDAVEKADRRIDKAKEHLAQAKNTRVEAIRALQDAKAELAVWEAAAASSEGTAAPATAHDAGVRTESNN